VLGRAVTLDPTYISYDFKLVGAGCYGTQSLTASCGTAHVTTPSNGQPDRTSTPIVWRHLLIGAGGGVASVAMFYSAVRGAMGLSLVLLPLVPLPMLIAGFGWGLAAAVAAAVCSTVLVAGIIGPMFAFGFALALAVPAVGLTYLISLVRYDENGAVADWLSIGRVLMAMALYGAALPVLLIALDGGNYSVMRPDFTRLFKQVSEQAPVGSSWRGMSDAQVQSLANLWVQLMPAVIASYWTFFLAVNTYLAGRIVRISDRLHRPWPDLHWLTYPPVFALAAVAALAGIAVGGSLRVIGIAAIGAFSVAFLLQGLAVVHAVAHKRGATWLIAAVYASLFVAGAIFAPLLAALGVAETLTRVRSRIVPIPPALPPGSI
jgi:Predicted membrane protein (DUF2232)